MGPAALPRCRGSIPSLYCSRRSLKPTTPMGQYPLVPSHSGPLAVWGWRPVPDHAGTVPPPRRRASWHGPSEASARSFAASCWPGSALPRSPRRRPRTRARKRFLRGRRWLSRTRSFAPSRSRWTWPPTGSTTPWRPRITRVSTLAASSRPRTRWMPATRQRPSCCWSRRWGPARASRSSTPPGSAPSCPRPLPDPRPRAGTRPSAAARDGQAGPADRRRGAGAGRPCDGLEDPMSDATIDRGATRPAPPIPWRRRALDALDERLGLKGLQYPIPAHANTLAYSLGGLALISFVLMVASGIFLTQYYNPDPALAHASVRHIITGVTGGDFIRAFHYWGAMAMIVLIGLHLLRVFASASFKRPREGNWVIGVALAGITAGLFFSGSVLKWDQESLEALEHNIEIGKLLGRFGFWFSDTFGGVPLLTRLYVVHISVLPALFTLAVAVHLLLVKRHGMAPSPFRREAAKDAGPEPTRPFTRHLAELGVLGLVLVGVLMLLAVLLP